MGTVGSKMSSKSVRPKGVLRILLPFYYFPYISEVFLHPCFPVPEGLANIDLVTALACGLVNDTGISTLVTVDAFAIYLEAWPTIAGSCYQSLVINTSHEFTSCVSFQLGT